MIALDKLKFSHIIEVNLFLIQLYKHYGKSDDRPNETKNELYINCKKIPGHIRALGVAIKQILY